VARVDRHFRLTERSAVAWDRFLTRHRISLTAFAEAVGELLSENEGWVPEQAIERAKEIDSERRSRR
jgi:hypothetical protein